jgi:hypothetical protein
LVHEKLARLVEWLQAAAIDGGPRELQKRSVFCHYLLISLGIAGPADLASADESSFAYTTSGTCLASPEGFKPNLEPVNSGVAWTTTFSAAGSADGSGRVREVGQSLDSASFGVGPRMHMPAAHAYKDTFSSAVTGPEEDGSFRLQVKALQGTFTAGPYDRVTFAISDFELKRQIGGKEVAFYGSNGSPVIQTVSLGNGATFKRICVLTMSMSARR